MLINSSELRAAGFKLKEVLDLQHLRQLHVVARDCEVLRVWVLKGLFCQWMMTLNSGHDMSD
jgi:cell division inhibitor SulA